MFCPSSLPTLQTLTGTCAMPLAWLSVRTSSAIFEKNIGLFPYGFLGSILEGPEPAKLKGMVDQAYDLILAMMQDESIAVRDSAAWVVQRICQLVREAVLVEARFQNTVIMLRQNLAGPPRVAANVCWVSRHLKLDIKLVVHSQSTTDGTESKTESSFMFYRHWVRWLKLRMRWPNSRIRPIVFPTLLP